MKRHKGSGIGAAAAAGSVLIWILCAGCSHEEAGQPSLPVTLEAATEPAPSVSVTAVSAEDNGEQADSEKPSAAQATAEQTPTETAPTEPDPSAQFYITEIDDGLFERMYGKSFKEDCTLPREDLRYLHVLHKNLEGETLEGEMVVNVHIAEDVLEIFKELYEAGYPIEKMKLVDDYGADDGLSMEDNNSSSFNFRFISHTTKVSLHGLGLAVDINTLYNPYVKTVDGQLLIEPVTAEPYTHRDEEFPYKIERDDLCCRLFKEHGFDWGGDWKNTKDYQHFEVPAEKAEEWYPGMR